MPPGVQVNVHGAKAEIPTLYEFVPLCLHLVVMFVLQKGIEEAEGLRTEIGNRDDLIRELRTKVDQLTIEMDTIEASKAELLHHLKDASVDNVVGTELRGRGHIPPIVHTPFNGVACW
jgi:hypothetical protein